ncbi:MAG: DUF433 domain-containing protein [Candidatus Hydrogenedentes bacterium]|nr:DUF433 domain-containing protein [Candidatus Hydrogenedentota bacterium]
MNEERLLERITCDPDILCGKPVIAGTRLSVEFMLNLLAHGATTDEILEEYSGIAPEDVRACMFVGSLRRAHDR